MVLGRATRLVRFLPHSPKVYEGTLRLGLTTSTDDLTGRILTTSTEDIPEREAVLDAAARLRGRSTQTPPAVSARKVGGTRMYRLARQGRPALGLPTEVEVFRFDIGPARGAGLWSFEAEVSAGTYIRSLARDLGILLGCGGTLASLRRLRIGPMSIADSTPLPAKGRVDPKQLLPFLVPLERMPLTLPPVHLTDREAADRFAAGTPMLSPRPWPEEGPCRVFDGSGRLLGVADATGGRLQPRVVLTGDPP